MSPDAFARLKICQKCICGRIFVPDPTGGAHSAPPDPYLDLGAASRREMGRGVEGRGKGGKGQKEGEKKREEGEKEDGKRDKGKRVEGRRGYGRGGEGP